MKRILLAIVFYLASGIACAQPLHIEGRIINGTNQADGKAEAVTLLTLGQGMQEIATLKNIQGAFRFPLDPVNGSGPFLLRALYQGVQYFKTVPPLKEQTTPVTEIMVYDSVDSMDKAQVSLPHLFIKRDENQLLFVWNYEIVNPTNTTMHREGGIFPVWVPQKVQSMNISASSGRMPVRVGLTKDEKLGGFRVNYALKPGKTAFEISYAVDYAQEKYALKQPLYFPFSKVVALIYPEDMAVKSEGLREMQVDKDQHVKIAGWENPWGDQLALEISGGAKIAAHEQGQGTDHQVVERAPAVASVKWLTWGLMALGLGLNVFLFFRQRSTAAMPSFDFPSLGAFQIKLADLESQAKAGRLDQRACKEKRQALIKEAWNCYLEETGGN